MLLSYRLGLSCDKALKKIVYFIFCIWKKLPKNIFLPILQHKFLVSFLQDSNMYSVMQKIRLKSWRHKIFPLRTFKYDPRSQRVYTCIANKFDCKQDLPKIVKTLSKNLTKYKIWRKWTKSRQNCNNIENPWFPIIIGLTRVLQICEKRMVFNEKKFALYLISV